jgi:hypothetical protein
MNGKTDDETGYYAMWALAVGLGDEEICSLALETLLPTLVRRRASVMDAAESRLALFAEDYPSAAAVGI